MTEIQWFWLAVAINALLLLAALGLRRFGRTDAAVLFATFSALLGTGLTFVALLRPVGVPAPVLVSTLVLCVASILMFYVALAGDYAEYWQTLRVYSAERGFRFEESRPGHEARFVDFVPLFQYGDVREWNVTISSQDFTAFSYQYGDPDGDGGHKWSSFGIMLWYLNDVELPRFWVIPKSFQRQFLGFLRRNVRPSEKDVSDVILEAQQGPFSVAYEVVGAEPDLIRSLLSPQLCLLLMEQPGRRGISGKGHTLVYWQKDGWPEVDKLDEFLADGERLLRILRASAGPSSR